ncbi:MAG TPA: hypothetical protein VLM79_38260 [Kofleriaceae bacterium]|nr:hypothetical protein [Kofleriaceae bacterium]
MIALQADMDDADALAERHDDRGLADGAVHLAAAQAADGRNDAQHDMQRMAQLHLGPLVVGRATPGPLRLAAGASARSAVLEQLLLNMSFANATGSRRCHSSSISIPIAFRKLIEHI